MAVKLNNRGFRQAISLIEQRKFVTDEKDDWSEHQPSARDENEYITSYGFDEYSKWFLGIDTEEDEETKERYKFPFGDFERVHRCGVLAAEGRAGQYKYRDIENVAAHLAGMMEAARRE